jgi:hypothetical protein
MQKRLPSGSARTTKSGSAGYREAQSFRPCAATDTGSHSRQVASRDS